MSDDSREQSGVEEHVERFRGELFNGLDRLAFALELEAAHAMEARDEDEAARLEDRRLGVRLAQRLVAGVHADEVDLRVERTRREYDLRTSELSDRATRHPPVHSDG